MSKSLVILFILIFYILGIFLTNISSIIFFVSTIFVLIIFLLIFLKNRNYKYSLLIFLLFLFIGSGVSSINKSLIKDNLEYLKKFNKKQNIEVKIIKKAKVKEDKVSYIGVLKKISEEKVNKKIKIEIFLEGNYEYRKGDILYFNAKPYFYENKGVFKYREFMLSRGIYFRVYPFNYERISKEDISKIEKFLLKIKQKLTNNIKQLFPEQEAIFLGGILFGIREEIPKELEKNFNNSGLTHFIAVSGFNITILVIFFGFLVKYFPLFLRFLFVFTMICFFTILVGFGAPVVRASIMGIIAYAILLSGRNQNTWIVIFLSLAIMTSLSPLSINYDISLQLSFLAVFGIICLKDFFERIFYFLPNFLEIKTAFILTFSALAFTIPLSLFSFGYISIISPISNLLVAWTIPIAMAFGFLSILIYFISDFFGIFFGYIAWVLLKWDIFIVNFLGSKKFSILSYEFGYYSPYYKVFVFLILIFLVLFFIKKN